MPGEYGALCGDSSEVTSDISVCGANKKKTDIADSALLHAARKNDPAEAK